MDWDTVGGYILFPAMKFSSILGTVMAVGLAKSASANDKNKFKFFTAYPQNMTCSDDPNATPFNNQVRGVNLGSWMVLEPWITPSLFYQFLGGDEKTSAMDTYSFCEVLGPEEANKQLRRHWDTWVTEDIIKELAESGAVNSLRLPVGDYQYKPYGPYGKTFSNDCTLNQERKNQMYRWWDR